MRLFYLYREVPADLSQLSLRASSGQSGSLASRVNGVIATLRGMTSVCYKQLHIVAQGHPTETLLFPYLIEDAGGTTSYGDYLVSLHNMASRRENK